MQNNQESGSAMSLSQVQSASYKGLIGHSSIVEKIKDMVQMVASHSTTVLLTGESGSGKEVVARQIHDASERAGKPFIPVNCGAIPAELLESEMFGHEKGAFTGAIATRKGRFEMAEGGTLFLDEIGDMSLPMQVKLLRVLQERKFDRVGSNKSQECNVRIITATHRDLEKMIEEGTFRQDLYFRINVYPIELPALRDHVEDIPDLLDHLIGKMMMQGHERLRFSEQVIKALGKSTWLGNIRELSNLIERLTITNPASFIHLKDLPEKYRQGMDIMADTEILTQMHQPDHADSCDEIPEPALPSSGSMSDLMDLPKEGMDLKQHVADVERHYITQALAKSSGVVSKAAVLLKIRRTTLVEKIRKLEKQDEQENKIHETH